MRSADGIARCRACHGAGTLPGPVLCRRCTGTGLVVREPDWSDASALRERDPVEELCASDAAAE